jgi:cobaltochelatase CobT
MSNFFESSLEKVARILARQYGIQVRFEGTGAYTDGKVINLPNLPLDKNPELREHLNGYLDHEVAHCLFTDFDQIVHCINAFHKNMLNMVEDSRIEILMGLRYPGAKNHLNALNKHVLNEIDKQWDEISAPFRTLLNVRNIMEGLPLRLDPDTKELFDENVIKLCQQLSAIDNTEGLRIKTHEIVTAMLANAKDAKEKEKKKEKKTKKSSEKGKSSEKDGESSEESEKSSEEGENSSEDNEKSSEENGKSSEKEGKTSERKKETSGEGGKTSEEKRETSEGKDSKKKSERTVSEKELENCSNKSKKVVDIHSFIEEKIEDLKEDIEHGKYWDIDFKAAPHIAATNRYDRVDDLTKDGDRAMYAKSLKDLRPFISRATVELDRMLNVKENARVLLDRHRGMLAPQRLTQLIVNPNFQTPFKEKTKSDTRNLAISIVIDLSGSMLDYGKIKLAKDTAIVIAESLKTLGFEFEIGGFTTTDANLRCTKDDHLFNRFEGLQHFIFKSFDSTELKPLQKINNLQLFMMNNCDGESIRFFAKRLSMRNKKRKILFVLSDGYPACARSDKKILNEDLRKAVRDISKHGIETVGIGILSDSVRKFYPNNVVVGKIDDLPKEAMKKLKDILLRSKK